MINAEAPVMAHMGMPLSAGPGGAAAPTVGTFPWQRSFSRELGGQTRDMGVPRGLPREWLEPGTTSASQDEESWETGLQSGVADLASSARERFTAPAIVNATAQPGAETPRSESRAEAGPSDRGALPSVFRAVPQPASESPRADPALRTGPAVMRESSAPASGQVETSGQGAPSPMPFGIRAGSAAPARSQVYSVIGNQGSGGTATPATAVEAHSHSPASTRSDSPGPGVTQEVAVMGKASGPPGLHGADLSDTTAGPPPGEHRDGHTAGQQGLRVAESGPGPNAGLQGPRAQPNTVSEVGASLPSRARSREVAPAAPRAEPMGRPAELGRGTMTAVDRVAALARLRLGAEADDAPGRATRRRVRIDKLNVTVKAPDLLAPPPPVPRPAEPQPGPAISFDYVDPWDGATWRMD